MRYRRLSYRYAVVMAATGPRPFADVWHRQPAAVSAATACWRPAADVVETATEVHVTVELAGVDHDDLDVLLFEDALIVEGERRLPPAHAAGVYHAAEIRQGKLRLELRLPCPIDPEQVDARYERGLLDMRLVKRAASATGGVSIPISQTVDSTATTTSATDRDGGARARAATRRERDEHGA